MIEVVAAIIELDRKILAFQRGNSKHSYVANKFEFPGGKVEANEDFKAALTRELTEELGLEANVGRFVTTVEHTYPDFTIKMHCFLVHLKSFDGELREHVNYAHVTLTEAAKLEWIEADRPLLELLRDKYRDVFD